LFRCLATPLLTRFISYSNHYFSTESGEKFTLTCKQFKSSLEKLILKDFLKN